MIKEIEAGGVKHSITLADDMIGKGLKRGENGIVEVDINEEKLVKTTWAELKALRDEAKLVAGMKYRITDYVTTTVQTNTKSAGNPFDIIVEAISEKELSEKAQAIQHEGDTYFDGNDLSVWELWYDLDNDTTKYEWADATNGKGVIYRMIDEKRNDCPYDFKNILFYTYKYTNSTTADKYYYTFSYVVSSKLFDGTVEKQVKYCYSNSMDVYRKSNKKSLNRNIFRNAAFGDNCYSNTFGDNCDYNTFGDNCAYNTFGYNCDSNTFGDNCDSNTFGDNCYYNTFGDNCDYNTFGDNCYYNTFGDELQNRNINANKTSITLNEEYYDDGKNALVPIKHPDLSTQPSILPYKFMGQYVYEQLIPTSELIIDGNGSFAHIPTSLIGGDFILGCCIIGTNGVAYIRLRKDESTNVWSLEHDRISGRGFLFFNYIKIVYTSMPEDSSYYGYNNY